MRQFGNYNDMSFRPASIGLLPLLTLFVSGVVVASEPVNFILLMGDDHGWEETGYYDHPHVKTPVIDEMASQGLRFDYFYSAHSSCSPTRGSFLTGRHPNRYGTFTPGYSIRPEEITIAHLLKSKGYRCGHFGKWHIGIDRSNGVYGIDENDSGGRPDRLSPKGRDTPIYEKAIDFIRRHKDEPFYVNIWGFTTHAPVASAPNFLEVFKDVKVNRADFSEYMQPVFDDSTTIWDDLDLNMRHYLGNVYALDLNVKMVMDALDELELADNTVLVFSSDQGPARPLGKCLDVYDPDLFAPKVWKHMEKLSLKDRSGTAFEKRKKKHFQNMLGNTGPFRGYKGSSQEGGLRVPFIVRWPGKVKANFVDTENVIGLIDWLPTICSLAGVKNIPNDLDGEDVSDIWLGGTRKRTKPLLWGPREPGLTIREDQWKYYLLFDEQKQYYGEALYDVLSDPGEKSNLAESHPEIASRLKAKLMEFYEELPKKIIKTGNYKHQY